MRLVVNCGDWTRPIRGICAQLNAKTLCRRSRCKSARSRFIKAVLRKSEGLSCVAKGENGTETKKSQVESRSVAKDWRSADYLNGQMPRVRCLRRLSWRPQACHRPCITRAAQQETLANGIRLRFQRLLPQSWKHVQSVNEEGQRRLGPAVPNTPAGISRLLHHARAAASGRD